MVEWRINIQGQQYSYPPPSPPPPTLPLFTDANKTGSSAAVIRVIFFQAPVKTQLHIYTVLSESRAAPSVICEAEQGRFAALEEGGVGAFVIILA